MPQKNPKVLLLGMDGADFEIIDRLTGEGKLPHLASLMRNGTRGTLRSSLMPNSYPAWTSCLTGVNPGKHGIFWSLLRSGGPSSPFRLMNSSDIRVWRVWDLLGREGCRVGVFNIPTEYPPSPVSGFMVCGALTPGPDVAFTHPPELREELLAQVPGYRCEIDFAGLKRSEMARQIMSSIENREKLILHLLREKPWDAFFAVFTETDLAQHFFWAGIDPGHPNHRRLWRKFGTFVYDVYERLDEAVGRIIEHVPPETTVFIVSDHGFGPFYQSFSIPRWLADQNYLALKPASPAERFKALVSRTAGPRGIHMLRRALAALGVLGGRRRTVRDVRAKDASSSRSAAEKILWEQTRAYFTPDQGIRINLRGRESHGTVQPGPEAVALLAELSAKLKELKYSNGRSVFEAVQLNTEAFSGPFVDAAPDLIVPINYADAPPDFETWDYLLTHPTANGAHRPEGVLIARGPGIRAGGTIRGATIIDVTPTILHLFGAPLTTEMDGSILFDLFSEPPQPDGDVPRRGSSLIDGSGSEVLSEADRLVLEQRLRDLGYID